MRKFSLKRAKENRIYLKNRIVYLEAHPYCEAEIQCHGLLATEIHHKKGRIGDLLNNTAFWLATRRTCHGWIHQNDQRARELGFLLSRLN